MVLYKKPDLTERRSGFLFFASVLYNECRFYYFLPQKEEQDPRVLPPSPSSYSYSSHTNHYHKIIRLPYI